MPQDDMEVDKPAAAGPNMFKTYIVPSTLPRVSIPEMVVQALSGFLEVVLVGAVLKVPPTLDPKFLLIAIWGPIHEALSQDETLKTRVANEGQFLKNVDEIGMESFINLLRDVKSSKSWRDLLGNSTYCLRLISSILIGLCFSAVFSKKPVPEWDMSLASKNGAQ
jgi:hypothetical protein